MCKTFKISNQDAKVRKMGEKAKNKRPGQPYHD
jgi:hypothetical protein